MLLSRLKNASFLETASQVIRCAIQINASQADDNSAVKFNYVLKCHANVAANIKTPLICPAHLCLTVKQIGLKILKTRIKVGKQEEKVGQKEEQKVIADHFDISGILNV